MLKLRLLNMVITTHGCYALWHVQNYIIMFSDKLGFKLTVKGLVHAVTILRTYVRKGIKWV